MELRGWDLIGTMVKRFNYAVRWDIQSASQYHFFCQIDWYAIEEEYDMKRYHSFLWFHGYI